MLSHVISFRSLSSRFLNALVELASITSFIVDLTEVDLMEKRLAELRDRLHYAESLNQEREHDLLILRSPSEAADGLSKAC